jgi:hypothetical protein
VDITDVANFIQSFDNTEFLIDSVSSTGAYIKILAEIGSKLPDFSEVIFRDQYGNCILYSYFPMVRYFSKMLSTTHFEVSVIL